MFLLSRDCYQGCILLKWMQKDKGLHLFDQPGSFFTPQEKGKFNICFSCSCLALSSKKINKPVFYSMVIGYSLFQPIFFVWFQLFDCVERLGYALMFVLFITDVFPVHSSSIWRRVFSMLLVWIPENGTIQYFLFANYIEVCRWILSQL